jgi:hypothetical protein
MDSVAARPSQALSLCLKYRRLTAHADSFQMSWPLTAFHSAIACQIRLTRFGHGEMSSDIFLT